MSRAKRNPVLRTLLVGLGLLIMLLSPIVGVIPGPGGIFVFGAGLILVLQNSRDAQVHFVRIKRRWPQLGHYADMALRRRSARRRRERQKQMGQKHMGVR